MEPSGTCAGHLAAVLGLRKASLLQAALQEAVVVGSPGPGLCPLGGALAVQAHVEAPGAREVVWGWQARASSPWALLVLQALGAQEAVPLGTQLIRGELEGGEGHEKWWVLGGVSKGRIKSLKSDLTLGYIQGRPRPKNRERMRLDWGIKTRNV